MQQFNDVWPAVGTLGARGDVLEFGLQQNVTLFNSRDQPGNHSGPTWDPPGTHSGPTRDPLGTTHSGPTRDRDQVGRGAGGAGGDMPERGVPAKDRYPAAPPLGAS